MVVGQLWPHYQPAVLDRLSLIASSNNLGAADPHESVSRLEAGFVGLLGGGQAAFFNSGTSALVAALFGLQLPQGSEVIVPVSTFRSTVTPLLQLGLRPAIAACDANTLISPESVQTLISDRTSAIIVNHQWGIPAEMDAIVRIARHHGLALIEDASHAHASVLAGQHVGTFGDASFFSCGTTKMVTGGLGGILWSAKNDLFERSICLGLAKHVTRNRLTSSALAKVASVGLGLNLRGHPLAAELAHSHLASLDSIVVMKDANLRRLDLLVAETFPTISPVPRPARWSAGTWYKRPYRARSPAEALDFLSKGRAAGLRLEATAPNTDNLLDQLTSGISAGLPACGIDASYVTARSEHGWDFRSIVLHDTRDMYLEVDWETLSARLRSTLSTTRRS